MSTFPDLILRRIGKFFGYGSLKAPVWIVGMEEGFTGHLEELEMRFKSADGKITIDTKDDMLNVKDHVRFHQDGAPIQPYFKFPICLYLALTIENFNKLPKEELREKIREYQINKLSRMKEDTASLELMPLPVNKINEKEWSKLYSQFGILELQTKKIYLEKFKPDRERKLKELINEHKPSLVIFNSGSEEYKVARQQIAPCHFQEITRGMYACHQDGATYCILPQRIKKKPGYKPANQEAGLSYERVIDFALKIKGEVFLRNL